MRISEDAREALKRPLGNLFEGISSIRAHLEGKRVISVGDVCTLSLLESGITPHLAVFDFRFKRTGLRTQDIETLKTRYPGPMTYSNPPGTLSDELVADAKEILEHGGAVFIEGEEDLTALAFILAGEDGDVLIYGQPDQGLVLVEIDEKVKKRIRELLGI